LQLKLARYNRQVHAVYGSLYHGASYVGDKRIIGLYSGSYRVEFNNMVNICHGVENWYKQL